MGSRICWQVRRLCTAADRPTTSVGRTPRHHDPCPSCINIQQNTTAGCLEAHRLRWPADSFSPTTPAARSSLKHFATVMKAVSSRYHLARGITGRAAVPSQRQRSATQHAAIFPPQSRDRLSLQLRGMLASRRLEPTLTLLLLTSRASRPMASGEALLPITASMHGKGHATTGRVATAQQGGIDFRGISHSGSWASAALPTGHVPAVDVNCAGCRLCAACHTYAERHV